MIDLPVGHKSRYLQMSPHHMHLDRHEYVRAIRAKRPSRRAAASIDRVPPITNQGIPERPVTGIVFPRLHALLVPLVQHVSDIATTRDVAAAVAGTAQVRDARAVAAVGEAQG